MAYIALYWGVMIIGYFLGSRLRSKAARFGFMDKIMLFCISLLVFLMGIRMGCNEEVIKNLGTIGLQGLLITVALMAGAVLSVTITRRLLGIDKLGRLRGRQQDAGDGFAESELEVVAEAEAEEKSSNSMTLVIILFTVIGLLCGYFVIRTQVEDLDGFNEKAGTIMTIGLCLLLGVIGFEMGLTGTVISQLKKIGVRVLAFPIAVLVGTTLTGIILSLFLPLTLGETLAVSYGFGWYTFAPVSISNAGHVVAGAISFMHNVFRELGGIILIPLLAKKIGYIEVTSLPGVAAMDIGLPLVEKATRQDIIVYSFAIGISQSLLVPILVPLALSI